jgi:hypothetical protein
MKQAMEQMSNSLAQQKGSQQPNVNVDIDADIKETGQTRTINGVDAHQVVVTMTMAAADPQSGQAGAMKVNSEVWLAKDIPGSREMREFYKRMAAELDWAPTGMGAMMNRPDLSRAMAKMMSEGERMDGTPVEQIMRVSMDGAGLDAGSGNSGQPAARPSLSDALGGALGGKLGGFGGFGKKKKQDSSADSSDKDASSADKQQVGNGSLMEMTIDDTGFSTGAADASLFVVPGDFKKVEEALPGAKRK